MTEEVPTGICLPLRGFDAGDALRFGQLAEELGYDSVWVSELASYDAIAVATAIAATTERIRIGTAIVPFTTRSPALQAMSASTLGAIAGDRSMIGYGLSTDVIIEGWHGQDLPKALPTVRDLFTILDQALGGEPTGHRGKVLHSNGFRLEKPATAPPQRYVGALGPKMRGFTRENADGLILNFAPRSALAGIAERERPEGRDFGIVLPIRTAIGGSHRIKDQVRRFRRESASYMRVPVYEHSLRELGYGDVVDQVKDRGSLQEMADALPEDFIDDMGLLGTPERCHETMAGMYRDGVTPLIVPVTDPGDGELYEATIRSLT
ncbi:MAG: LLM class flavin-dependent oxidoreductase [Actinomycetota bacterium]|nr:LLM class flavin-dependent oxidoreductase [Actinomycetota bacterium]